MMTSCSTVKKSVNIFVLFVIVIYEAFLGPIEKIIAELRRVGPNLFHFQLPQWHRLYSHSNVF